MSIVIEESWKAALKQEFDQPYFQVLTDFIKKQYAQHTCYPKGSDIFAALTIAHLIAPK